MDVVKCMYPMHIMCRLFGIAFYRITRKNGKVEIERCGRLYELIFILSYLFKLSTTANHSVQVINERHNTDRPVIVRYTIILEALAAFLTNLALFVFAYVKKTEQMKLWMDLVELDLNLKDLKCSVKYRFVQVTSYAMIFGQVSVVVALAMEMFWRPRQKLFQATLFYEWQFLRVAFRIQLLVWVLVLREVFLALLGKFGDDVGEVPKLRQLHEKACRLLRRFNDVFSGQILFCVGLDFVVITILSYYTYNTIYHKAEWDDKYVYMCWIGFYVLDLVVLTVACYRCCGEANCVVKRNLCAIVDRPDQIQPRYKKEIHAFILQLLHNEVRLTACGFFSIDGSLIFAVSSALTTYLVILIQFDLNLGSAVSVRP